ncbi:MAG: lysophospholipid acyltransferase family protein [Pseudomonadota bacterium]
MDKLQFFLITCIAIPLSRLPLSWLQSVGSIAATALIYFNPKRTDITRRNLEACFPELSVKERKILLKKTAAETGKWMMEAAYTWFGQAPRLIKAVVIKNPDILEQAYKQGRGVVVILPHLGNWEMMNFYLPQHYLSASLYKPSASPIVEYVIAKGRSRLGASLFATDSGGMRKAFRHLKKGGLLVILSDHLPSRSAGVYAPFFGLPALTGKFTQSLVNFNRSNVVVTTAFRLPKGRGFEIVFEKVEGMDTEDSVAAATQMNLSIEKMVRLAPEQYQWVYKRFAKQPKGQKDIYSQ